MIGLIFSLFISFIQDRSQPLWMGIALSLLMFVVDLVQSLVGFILFFTSDFIFKSYFALFFKSLTSGSMDFMLGILYKQIILS